MTKKGSGDGLALGKNQTVGQRSFVNDLYASEVRGPK